MLCFHGCGVTLRSLSLWFIDWLLGALCVNVCVGSPGRVVRGLSVALLSLLVVSLCSGESFLGILGYSLPCFSLRCFQSQLHVQVMKKSLGCGAKGT